MAGERPGTPAAEGERATDVAGLPLLLGPKLAGPRRQLRARPSPGRTLLLAGAALVFWGALFAVLYRVLAYFHGADALGDVLAARLLGLILLTLLGVLLLSNVITALSTFFLDRDLEFLMAAPLDGLRIYGARLAETLVQSSWMVVLVLVPILSAYGVVYEGGPLYVATVALAIPPFLILPAVAGSAVTLLLVHAFPARRARDLLAVIALFAIAGLVVLVRLLRPEQLAGPDADAFREMARFVAALEAPQSVWLPSEWLAQSLMAALGRGGYGADLFPVLLLAATAAAAFVAGAWLHGRLHGEGYSRAQEGAERRSEGSRGERLEGLLHRIGLSPTTSALVAKDVRCFFRDTTQWSQLILLGVLVVIYVYNISVLPLRQGEAVGFFMVNVVAFLNLGLAGFVLAATAARFLLPAFSLEGRTLWLLRSSPLQPRALIWCKYVIGVIPLLALALALTVATNSVLRVGPFMMTLSLVTIAVVTCTIAALALAFGVSYPRLDSDNAAEVSTGLGGLLFMMTALAYLAVILVLEAWPVHTFLKARLHGAPLGTGEVAPLAGGFLAALALSVAAGAAALRSALRRAETAGQT